MTRSNPGDAGWMWLAIAEARRGQGLTRPNPPVGAVVVRGNRVVGSGFHPRAGDPHAEVFALRAAGKRARGATLYVTLEPCSTHGRTPPCVDAIIAAGISRVVYAVEDPNPRHTGRAGRLLGRAGITVAHGILHDEAAPLIAPFRQWVRTGLPYVTLKLALSLDGRIADSGGHSKWITCIESRARVQELRRIVDAVLVGAGTALADDPRLTVRGEERQPLRIIVDSRGRISDRARLFARAHVDTALVATTSRAPLAWRRSIEKRGGRIILCRHTSSGRVDLRDLLVQLGEEGILHVLCEGGGTLAASLLKKNLLSALCLFYGPRVLGDGARAAFSGAGWTMATSPGFAIREMFRSGTDVCVTAIRGEF